MSTNAWVLPDQISDVLPRQARTLEALRRGLLDLFKRYGYELVLPPLVEYTDALLDDEDDDLNLRTVKWADQLTGRTLAIRADMTPQVARIDAHLLNRRGVTRLCYFGSVFHARAAGLLTSREPLPIGAEIYGHQGLEADAEIQTLLIEALQFCQLPGVRVDVSHAQIVRAILADVPSVLLKNSADVYAALQAKDTAALRECTQAYPDSVRAALLALLDLYGGVEVLARARAALPASEQIARALDELTTLAQLDRAGVVQFDLADLTGYSYHTGVTFAAYCDGVPNAIARGGRYDRIGERFGRARPATGFSLDLREITEILPTLPAKKAIGAPWLFDASLQAAMTQLRAQGEVVIPLPAGDAHEEDEFVCDRELVREGGQWLVKAKA
ncbi:MAG: ATP phosphoribosyltransferase regulatory subunit [Burkholderiaceae bacterium]|jgi:ATP phosphoribosyltransferase regulatory subunit